MTGDVPGAFHFPKVLTAIISYDSPALTQRTYEQLVANTETHVVVLDHSSREDLIFASPHTIDLGREVKTYGETFDVVLQEPQFREYDYVGIWCNDVFNIPPDLIERMFTHVALWPRPVGTAAASIVRGGSPHPHMNRQGFGLRPVPFVETIAPYFHRDLLPIFERYVPMPTMGWMDIALGGISRALGFDNVVFDDAELGHVQDGGTFKELGQLKEHDQRAPIEALSWIERNNLVAVARWTAPHVISYLEERTNMRVAG